VKVERKVLNPSLFLAKENFETNYANFVLGLS